MDNYNNPIAGKTYISPRLDAFGDPDMKIRIASKVFDSEENYAFGSIKDEVVLRHKGNAQKNIKAKFIEDNRGLFVLSIQGYSVATDKPHNASFSFIGDEINILRNFIDSIEVINLENSNALTLSDEEVNNQILSNVEAKDLLNKNLEMFTELIKSEITTEDIITVGYRKKQLFFFEKLLSDQVYFETVKEKKGLKTEAVWQKFFEKNQWIFGYGLGYVFLSSLNDKKLEQIVQGFTVSNNGKRVDALMKTQGIISNLCFIEIKTHTTPLMEKKSYRADCWAPSRELSGAIAQIQGTVDSAVDTLSHKITIEDKDGNPTGEEAYNYHPKSYLVIGNLEEFATENGINKAKYRSFELFRKNISNPEILTFDELYERAKYIIKNNES